MKVRFHPENLELIDNVICAICGCDLDTLAEMMEENKLYYEAL